MSKANYTLVQSLFTLWSSHATHHIMAVRLVASKYSSSAQKPKDEPPARTVTLGELSQKCAGPNENYMVSIVSCLYVEPTNELVNVG